MTISIFGAGYVGITSAAFFSEHGIDVIVVDVNPKKVELINQGRCPIDNEELKLLIEKNWRERRILATSDSNRAVMDSTVSIISVGTPSSSTGEVDLHSAFSVFRSIGKSLRNKNDYHLIIMRSTCPPGTTRHGLEIVQQFSGKKAGCDFGGCMSPEFLRGWSLVNDFCDPPFTIIGQYDEKSGILAESLYQEIKGELIKTELEIAEMVKYVCNSFHALKTSFANEIGRTCKQLGIDSREVMNIFMKDTKLSLSGSYLKPGFAFGGSCLPKDVTALSKIGRKIGANPVLLGSILESNSLHIDYLVDKIIKLKANKIGVVGITYHTNSDDLRNSQAVELVKRLIDNKFSVSIYDTVDFNTLIGANKTFVESLPFKLSSLLVSSLEELVTSVDVIIIVHKKPGVEELISALPANKHCIDLGDLYENRKTFRVYDGVCW